MENSIYQHLIRGAGWSAIMRWGVRFIGLINIIILARLLTPQDFGVVAMATIVIGFLKSSVEFGSHQLLIRQQDATEDDINAAWTIKIIQGVVVAILMIIAAPFVAEYFDDQRVVQIIYVLSISSILYGVCNVGMTLARKELNFALDFKINIYNRLAGFFVTLLFVLYFRNFWGLVYGHVASAILELLISFLMHPYRPRVSFKKIYAYVQFSYSIVPIRIAKFIQQKVDSIVVGGMANATQLGYYNIASDISKMMTSEVAIPLARGLYPGYAKLASQPQALMRVFNNVLATTCIIVVPLGMGVSVVADELVYVVLGEQWLPAAGYIKWLGIGAVFYCLSFLMSSNILIVSGFEKRSAILSWVYLVILVPSVVLAGKSGGPQSIAAIIPVVSAIFLCISIVVLSRTLPITVSNLLKAMWRPFFSGILMAVVVTSCRGLIDSSEILTLLFLVLVGAISYFLVLAILWLVSGRPNGLESLCYNYIFGEN